jgi:hypothetical protein
MLDDVREYVRAGISMVTSQGADGLPASLASRAQAMAEQLAAVAEGFFEWSGEARASLLAELKLLIAAQIKEIGVASQEEVQRLTERVERLERESKSKTKTKAAPSARRPASKRTSTRASARTRTSRRKASSRSSSPE